MTKKKKLIIISVIIIVALSVAAVILFFILKKPSIEGEWYNENFFDYGEMKNIDESTLDIMYALSKKPYKFTFNDTEMEIVYRYSTKSGKETYYYKIDGDKLFYSKDHSSINNKYYIITKRTKDELRLKGTKIEDDEIVLKR